MDLDSTIQQIKKEFFAYRNGIVADALRKHNDCHKYIMGCQLTDVMTIAANYGYSQPLADRLWSDKAHRECRMMAPMLCSPDDFGWQQALEWCGSVENEEIADVLCHRLLRRLPYATRLYKHLLNGGSAMIRYVAFRLLLNLILIGKETPSAQIKAIAEAELPIAPTSLVVVLNGIIEECG